MKHMRRDGIERLIPLAGVLFAAVMLAALVLTRGEPDAGASKQVIFDYWHGHHGVFHVEHLDSGYHR